LRKNLMIATGLRCIASIKNLKREYNLRLLHHLV